MRVPVPVAVVALIASASSLSAQAFELGPQATRYTGEFAVSALDFFGPTGLTGRYLGSGCGEAGGFFGQYPCMDVMVETGIEAATGIGAVRYRITRMTSNTFGQVGLGGVGVYPSADGNPMHGTLATTSLPGSTRSASVHGMNTTDAVRRNTSLGEQNFDGTFLYETFVPLNASALLFYTYRQSFPTGPDCPLDRPERTCSGLATVRVSSFTNITAVPEPSTWALLGTGLLTLGGIAARRRKRAET